jgi:hypothetical protein
MTPAQRKAFFAKAHQHGQGAVAKAKSIAAKAGHKSSTPDHTVRNAAIGAVGGGTLGMLRLGVGGPVTSAILGSVIGASSGVKKK